MNSTYHNIEPPKLLDSLLDSALHIIFLAHIRFHSYSLCVGVLLNEKLSSLLCCIDVNIDKHDAGTF